MFKSSKGYARKTILKRIGIASNLLNVHIQTPHGTYASYLGRNIFIHTLHTCKGAFHHALSPIKVSPFYRQPIANRVSTPETLTEIRRISLTIASFNARRGAFSSEGGGEFEFGAFVYLPTTSFFLGGGAINTEQRKQYLVAGFSKWAKFMKPM